MRLSMWGNSLTATEVVLLIELGRNEVGKTGCRCRRYCKKPYFTLIQEKRMKNKLKEERSELVGHTNRLKLFAAGYIETNCPCVEKFTQTGKLPKYKHIGTKSDVQHIYQIIVMPPKVKHAGAKTSFPPNLLTKQPQ